METKRQAVRFRAGAVDVEKRTFEGLSAAYALDYGGDVIKRGAFMEDLKAWRSNPDRIIPLVDMHSYGSVRSVYGRMVDAHENDDGLWSRFEVVDSVDGDEALARIQGGMVNGLSIGFHSTDSEPYEMEGQKVRRLNEIELKEVSLVIWGMNPRALVMPGSVKHGETAPADTYSPVWDRVQKGTRLELPAIKAALPHLDDSEKRAVASYVGHLLRPGVNGSGDGEDPKAQQRTRALREMEARHRQTGDRDRSAVRRELTRRLLESAA